MISRRTLGNSVLAATGGTVLLSRLLGSPMGALQRGTWAACSALAVALALWLWHRLARSHPFDPAPRESEHGPGSRFDPGDVWRTPSAPVDRNPIPPKSDRNTWHVAVFLILGWVLATLALAF